MDIKRVVVSYNGSEESQKALNWGIYFGKVFGADLRTVTVVAPPVLGLVTSETDNYYLNAKNHYQLQLDKVREYGEQSGVPVKTVILIDQPAENIINYASNNGADLILTGTCGLVGFNNLIIGSVV
jgi:nucleotide-binding universal stress UspA family protein